MEELALDLDATDRHTYSAEWTPERVRFFIDDRLVRTSASRGGRSCEGWWMDDAHREAVQRFWQAFNDRDLSLLDDLFAEDYVNHATIPGTPPGPEGQAQLMQRLWTAFPDARFEIEHLAQDGDTVVCVGTMSGTHEGELFGIAGSGKPVAWRQCHLITIANGRATAHRAIRDDLGLMRQMGAA